MPPKAQYSLLQRKLDAEIVRIKRSVSNNPALLSVVDYEYLITLKGSRKNLKKGIIPDESILKGIKVLYTPKRKSSLRIKEEAREAYFSSQRRKYGRAIYRYPGEWPKREYNPERMIVRSVHMHYMMGTKYTPWNGELVSEVEIIEPCKCYYRGRVEAEIADHDRKSTRKIAEEMVRLAYLLDAIRSPFLTWEARKMANSRKPENREYSNLEIEYKGLVHALLRKLKSKTVEDCFNGDSKIVKEYLKVAKRDR